MIVRRRDLHFAEFPGRLSADPFGDAGEGISVRVVNLTRPRRRTPHRHPHSCEAIYVVEGAGAFWEEGRAERVAPGDCIFVPPGAAHATIPDEGSTMVLACFFPHGDLPANTEELPDPIDLTALPRR